MTISIERALARSAAALISALLNYRATSRGLYFICWRRSFGSLPGIVVYAERFYNVSSVGESVRLDHSE